MINSSNGFNKKVPKKVVHNTSVNFQPSTTNFELLGVQGQSKNDDEIKVEKALIELNEVRNDLIIHKPESIAAVTTVNGSSQPLPSLTTQSNFFNGTAASGFFKDGGSLLGNIDNMNSDQLKERLMVAEALMKKLYNRNKDVELLHKQKVEK